ncbi:5-carboxymethyl-2-hydroxymuconate Delta-isomerase [Limobrevibacterium gyesilva]|uniref:5-carboxymethyl-2-hydroxymuconate Delta-isomerase n=1 Tax=Limobrevibacterium gyesilva TaxID=2991712 RepID=A0AA41YUS9_9PROT|nr:5-carboxymethyl-2-hydroxymuconate Delta-isomerase [Limobrevibacterium gyesilva]MCW3476963.1 5-carboxymethyl-2-hydroxymuconate Delta-isomerase [Limobrevibacterium gyesilva]
MPHLTVEYSANLEPRLDVMGLLRAVHASALGTGVFEVGGIRVRAERRDQYVVADGDPANAFVAVHVRIGAGRDEATRVRMAEAIFKDVAAYLDPIYRTSPLAISLEVQQIDPVGSLKQNNLHARLKQRAGAA